MTKSPSPSVDEVAEDLSTFLLWVAESYEALARHAVFPDEIDGFTGSAEMARRHHASLVSPPKAGAGEPVTELEGLIDAYWDLAFNEGRENRTTDTPYGDAQRVRSAITARLKALANHEARGDGVRVTDAEALHGAIISRVMPFTRDDMTNGQAASLGEDLMGMIQRAALPPLGDGRAEIVEACAKVADQVRVRLTQQAHRGKLNQIDEHTAGIADDIAAAIRSLSNPGGGE